MRGKTVFVFLSKENKYRGIKFKSEIEKKKSNPKKMCCHMAKRYKKRTHKNAIEENKKIKIFEDRN